MSEELQYFNLRPYIFMGTGVPTSSDTHLKLQIIDKDVYKVAERDITSISIPGRSGDLTVDNGRYKNVEISYKCVMPDYKNNFNAFVEKITPLTRKVLYIKDSYNPDYYRRGYLANGASVIENIRYCGEATLTFNCSPYRYLVSGTTALSFSNSATSQTVSIQGSFTAYPAIAISPHESSISITIGGNSYIFAAYDKVILVNCEERYIIDSDNELKNSLLQSATYPTIPYSAGGNITISVSGMSSWADYVTLRPRWISL